MDNTAINKAVLKKLSKRDTILKRAIKPDKNIKIYKIKEVPAKGKRRSNLREDRRRPYTKSDLVYTECVGCDSIDGFQIYKPFYKVNYLNEFYYQLEGLYYANRNNPLIISDYGDYAIFFDKMNLYQLLEYCYIASPALAVYLFRYLVDMVYLLNIPKDKVNDFYIYSRLIVVRYTDNKTVRGQMDSIIRNSPGKVIVMPVGVDLNVYDLVPLQIGGSPYIPKKYPEPLRVFSKNGSVVVISDDAKNTWEFTLPTEFIKPGAAKYEMLLYPNVRY